MPNLLTTFIQNRLIQPAVQRQLAELAKDTRTYAIGASALPERTIRDAIGQPHDTDYHLLYAIYRLHADVAACVARWAGGVTGNGWHLGLMDESTEPTDAQRRRIEEVTLWLKNPNPHKRFNLILHETTSHLAVSGDAYWYKVRELWPIHPATLRIKSTEHGEITGYVQRINGKDAAHFDTDEIIHFRLASITNDLYGHSPLESILEEVGTDLQALRANRALFENDLAPSAILRMKDVADQKKAQAVVDMIKQAHTGAKNRHQLLTLFGLEGVEPYGHSLKDMEFTLVRSLTTDKVATAYGLPSLFLNQKGAARFATADTEERFFYNTTIKPLQDQQAEAITEELIHEIDPELKFSYNEPDFADPNEMRKDALEAQGKGILDDNEVRTRYFDFPAREEEEPEKEQSSDTADDDQESDEATEAPDQQAKRTTKAINHDEVRNRRAEALEGLETAILPAITRYFERQQTRYLESLEGTFKSTAVRKDAADILLDALLAGTDGDQELALVLFAELDEALMAGANEAQLQVGFSLDPTAAQQLVDEYLLTQSFTKAQGINQTTRDLLRTTLREGLATGESITDLSQRVRGVFADATTWRATLIARTETAQAYEWANQQALKQSGVVSVKEWLTARDERACPICTPLNGVRVPLEQSFPGNLEPGFAHVQCRCTSIGVIAE